MTPQVEVIIPNWNGREMLGHCLASLQRQTLQNFSVTVVDNGSTDGSISYLETKFPYVKRIALGHNTGFSYAVNQGINQASSPWVLLLNNDMEVAPTCFEEISKAIERYNDYSFFALKMMNYQQRGLIDGAGDAVLRGGVGYRLGTLEKDSPDYQHDREVFGACGGAALYNRTFFDRVGVFDPDFFAYLEDVDLNMRACRLGMSCMYLASAIVYHIGSATTGSKINALTVRLSTRNNIYVLVKNYSPGILFRFLPAIIIYQSAWILLCIKKRVFLPWLKGVMDAAVDLPIFYRKRKTLVTDEQSLSDMKFAQAVSMWEGEAVQSIMARRSSEGKNNFLLRWYCRLLLN
ncbi:MAG: glycosyltransferase family 2 protein [Desulforhopalus sp.]